jgi:SAM-dependent methyltransferase
MLRTDDPQDMPAAANSVRAPRPAEVTLAVPGMTAAQYVSWLEGHHPRLAGLLDRDVVGDPQRLAEHFAALDGVPGHADFAEAPGRGRGRTYRDRQKRYPLARATGYRSIFNLLDAVPHGMSPRAVVVDSLGGNGTLWRASRALLLPFKQPYLISADPSADMMLDAIRQDIPALRQAAQHTLLDSSTVDAAFFGYGLHHIHPADRPAALLEAFRYLKPGGLIVLHDFEEGTPTARWYSEALDLYTTTGHKFAHFTTAGYRELLRDAGFTDVKVFPMYDPFVFNGESAEAARFELLDHLVEMFGMVKLARHPGESVTAFSDRVESTLSPFATFDAAAVAFDPAAVSRFVTFQQEPGLWRAEFPRIALMASARKAI